MKTLLVSGSPRKGGNTETILKKIAEALEDSGIETELIHLESYSIHPCIGCEQCRRDMTCTQFLDGMHLLYPKIEESLGLVLGSPTYNYNITPYMKAFIDRMYPYFDFTNPRPGPYSSRLAGQGRKLLTVGVCEQKDASEMGYTIPAMSEPVKVLGYEVTSELQAIGHFAKGSVKKNTSLLEEAAEAGRLLARALLTR
jgi:multimeric flavodoxin WrbA